MSEFAGVPFAGINDLPNDYLRVLIHGPQGSGKTSLASTVATLGRTLFIDLTGERGVRSFAGAPYAKNVSVIRPESVTALSEIYWELAKGQHPYKAVVVDSVTAVQKMAMRYLQGHEEDAVREIGKGGKPAEWGVWGQAGDIMVDLATFWFGLADAQRTNPMHVIMTAQTKVKDNDEGTAVRTPDVQPAALSLMLATPDYVLYTDLEDHPEHMADPDNVPAMRHIVRIGSDPAYRTKARIPYKMRGKIPPVLGRKRPISLVDLGRLLEVGGIPPRRKAASKPTGATPKTPAPAGDTPTA